MHKNNNIYIKLLLNNKKSIKHFQDDLETFISRNKYKKQ